MHPGAILLSRRRRKAILTDEDKERPGLVKAELRAVARAVKEGRVGARLRINDVNKAGRAVGG